MQFVRAVTEPVGDLPPWAAFELPLQYKKRAGRPHHRDRALWINEAVRRAHPERIPKSIMTKIEIQVFGVAFQTARDDIFEAVAISKGEVEEDEEDCLYLKAVVEREAKLADLERLDQYAEFLGLTGDGAEDDREG